MAATHVLVSVIYHVVFTLYSYTNLVYLFQRKEHVELASRNKRRTSKSSDENSEVSYDKIRHFTTQFIATLIIVVSDDR